MLHVYYQASRLELIPNTMSFKNAMYMYVDLNVSKFIKNNKMPLLIESRVV